LSACDSCGKPTTLFVYFPEAQGVDSTLEVLEHEARELRRVFTSAEVRLLRCRVISREDWATDWRGSFPPEKVSARFWVVPTWEQPALPPEALPIIMEPGLAFGTGKHATTRQCLGFLEEIAGAEGLLPMTFLDAGCGSGILAMAACLLGAGRVFGLDIDPDAIQTARMNLGLNRLPTRVLLVNGPLESCHRGRFDLIAANLTARILREHSTLFADILAQGGRCILSGMLANESPEVARAYEDLGFRVVAEKSDPEEGWTALLLNK
jgi:ribosomal protein L11 methyltransferase